MKRLIFLVAMLTIVMSNTSCLFNQEVKMSEKPKGLTSYVGFTVSITGKVSEMPWQHMIQQIDTHPHIYYIDWKGDQTVVYTQQPIPCEGLLMIQGTVIETGGKTKRPGSDNVYSELQIKADKVECLEE